VTRTPFKKERLRGLLIWLATAIVVTAPLWLTLGASGLLFGGLGPFGILLFKPGDQVLGKLLVATLASLPTAVGVAVAWRRWSKLSSRSRVLLTIGLSALWHGPGALLWLTILRGLN